MKKRDKKIRALAICLIIVALALLGYAAYLQFAPKEEVQIGETKKQGKVSGAKDEERQKTIKKLSGAAFSNNEDGVKTILIFSEYDKAERYQRMTTLVYRDGADEPATEEQLYDVSDDGKKIIYDPEASPMERDLILSDSNITIDEITYTKDNIKKYTD